MHFFFSFAGFSQYVARLKLNRIRDQVGPYTQDVIDSSLVKLQEDVSI